MFSSVAFQKRFLSFIILFGLQVYETFWGMHHMQKLELVMPTAISRIPIALAYPVWKSDSWASDYPSLLASTPMTFTEKHQIVDLNLIWVFAIEMIYLLVMVCAIYYRSVKEETTQCVGTQQ